MPTLEQIKKGYLWSFLIIGTVAAALFLLAGMWGILQAFITLVF